MQGAHFLSFKHRLSLKPLVFQGLFILFFTLVNPVAPPAAAAQTGSSIFSNILVTPNFTLRAKEGELISMAGDPPAPIIPKLWNVFTPGSAEFSCDYKNCIYQMQISQKVINEPTAPLKVGIFKLTAVNNNPAETEAIFWTAWKFYPNKDSNPEKTQGMSLSTNRAEAAILPGEPAPWNPRWVWYFENKSFFRDKEILYMVGLNEGWKEEMWVRLPETPYKDFVPESTAGFRQFKKTLPAKTSAKLVIIVPYQPASAAQKDLLTSMTFE